MRIGLVSCVKSKASSPRPARDLYTSPYFGKMRRYVETSCDDWRILSALHGVVHPSSVIAPYEVTLKTMSRGEQRGWAARVFAQLRDECGSATTFEIHAGREYSRDLIPLLEAAGFPIEIAVPELPFGRRLQWYGRNQPGHRAR